MPRLQLKLALVIVFCYLFTICVIYKCIPMAQSSTSKVSNLQLYFDNRTKDKATQGMYKLNWNENDKVFFKKVKDSVKQIENDMETVESSVNCASNSPPKFRKVSAGIYIYSAYFDRRNGTSNIRMIAAVARSLTKEHLNASLRCIFNTTNNAGNQTLLVFSTLQPYEMCENHKKRYGGWMFSCQMPHIIQKPPSKIQIWFSNSTKTVSKDVCVISRDKNVGRRKLKFGVCVPPLHGDVRAKTLIEFVEFNRILGADIFILYVENSIERLSMDVRSVIRYYERQNVVLSFPWQLPFTSDSIWYHGQSLAINDCLYKNMEDFEYLAFTDLDEFIIPQHDLITWADIFSQINGNDPVLFNSAVGMSFKSTFYSEDFSRRVFSNEISMSVRTNRTKHFSFRRNKVIVRPEKIFELGIHHVSKPLQERDSKNIINVPTSVAHIHHYRTCVQEFGIHCQVRIEDFSVPNKYGQRIIDNYLKTMFDITP